MYPDLTGCKTQSASRLCPSCSALPSLQAVLTLSIWLKWIWRLAVCICNPPSLPPSAKCPEQNHKSWRCSYHWHRFSIYMSREIESRHSLGCDMFQDGNISEDGAGSEKGKWLWEASQQPRWSWLCRVQAGCNLHSAHLREQREGKKPLPPPRMLPFPCGSKYKNGSIAITTPLPSHLSALPRRSLPPSDPKWADANKSWAGDDAQTEQAIGGMHGCHY